VQDLSFGLRMLLKSRGFTVVAVLTLALGIGANTAIFSVVNALLLKALPYPHPERLGTIYTRITGSANSDERHNLNGEQFELLCANVPSVISAVSSSGTSGVNFRLGSDVRYLLSARVSASVSAWLWVARFVGQCSGVGSPAVRASVFGLALRAGAVPGNVAFDEQRALWRRCG